MTHLILNDLTFDAALDIIAPRVDDYDETIEARIAADYAAGRISIDC